MLEGISPLQPFAQYVLASQSQGATQVQLDEASQRERVVKLLCSDKYNEKKDRLMTEYEGVSAIWSKEEYPALHTQ